ncbi:MAG: CvpA family protein [uncultured bacterium]|nr:MAG: CvpA family protein [uncultured bacterium]
MAASFNWIDYVIIGIFFFSIIAGLIRGLAKEVISLLTLIAAFIVASMFSSKLAAMFTASSSVQGIVDQASSSVGVSAAQPVSYAAIGISFAVLFIGTIIVGAIVGFFLNLAFQSGILGFGNRLLGGIFGFARGLIINLVLVFVVQLTPFGNETKWHESYLVNSFQPAVEWLGKMVSPALADLKEKFSQSMQGMGSSSQDQRQ